MVNVASSLWQTRSDCPARTTVGSKARSASLSVKTTLVRGSLLANGYPSTHAAGGTITLALAVIACVTNALAASVTRPREPG
jgi:hypothetical protein